MVIGLLGGSFDPAHEGHAHLTREALRRFGLDRVWWLVTPGNPLKRRQPAPMAERMAQARRVIHHPQVVVTDIEARLGTRYTAETLKALQARYPGVRFVWLMGADNLAQFCQWRDWQTIARTVVFAIFNRPGYSGAVETSEAARHFQDTQIPAQDARNLATMSPPAWTFIRETENPLSSTEMRRKSV